MTPVTKLLLLIIGLFLFFTVRSMFAQNTKPPANRLTPAEAAARVKAGTAILIDVREPNEWTPGVAAPAYLLPLSDLRSDRKKWAHVLKDAKGKELLLYCRSGGRSGQAAAILAKEGFKTLNVGGFNDWTTAKLPTRKPDEPAGNE
ncbi:rhodanese-like domain-containing protein [Opitutaceae bacterium]|nr:rhodanese-like domain-containing protein [Opitutaceae bacterium]